jgi:hypothetical protein
MTLQNSAAVQQAARQAARASLGQGYLFNHFGSPPVYMSPVPVAFGIPSGMPDVSHFQTSMNSTAAQPIPPFTLTGNNQIQGQESFSHNALLNEQQKANQFVGSTHQNLWSSFVNSYRNVQNQEQCLHNRSHDQDSNIN